MSILVVDDHANSRLVLTTDLRSAGFNDLLIADSALQAFEILGIEDPSGDPPPVELILMDIVMPGIDGIEACQRIKECKKLQDIPIIMVTGIEDVKCLESAFDSGALDFMTKPVNSLELLARVRSALSLKSEIDHRKQAFAALEQQLLQSQRLEGFGRLAGALCHDIRNVLTPILGYSQLGLAALPPDDQSYQKFQDILKAAERASDLTNRMLVSLRSQCDEPQVTNLNLLIEDTGNLLRSLLKENIHLKTSLQSDLWLVNVDRIMTEQLLMNLAINASDAMPNGGIFSLETANISIEEGYTYESLEIPPWDYVVVSVSDTGIGIPEKLRSKIFEPFFTTKEVGKGTGLGLSTCATIVSESGGHIELFSEEGKGSTFKVFFPKYAGPVSSDKDKPAMVELPPGNETILVAEDEACVRDLVADVLEARGYTVLTATNGNDALKVSQNHADTKIDLLLSDVVMPQMGGIDLVNRLAVSRPDMKVLLTSGYINDTEGLSSVIRKGGGFIEKPFQPSALACKVREVLDAG